MKKKGENMIAITMYADKDGSWQEVKGFTRPFSGSSKLDETLDSEIGRAHV